MNYLAWNELLAQEMFNERHESQPIFVLLTKSQILHAAASQSPNQSETNLWDDFKNALVESIGAGCHKETLLDKALFVFNEKWDNGRYVDGKMREYPTYLTYLLAFSLPLTEASSESSGRSYYRKCSEYFAKEALPSLLPKRISQSKSYNWNDLWFDLDNWANKEKGADFGRVTFSSGSRWEYVEKPLSQSVISTDVLNLLPLIFFEYGLNPHDSYADSVFAQVLLDSRKRLQLNKQVVNALENLGSDSEIGGVALHFVKSMFEEWNGEERTAEPVGGIRRSWTRAPLKLTFQLDQNAESVKFSYRIKYTSDLPEDLKFGLPSICKADFNGWSEPLDLNIPFDHDFELRDEYNSWIIKFTETNIKLFVSGGNFQLSQRCFFEVNEAFPGLEMYLLCTSTRRNDLLQWGSTLNPENMFFETNFQGVPQGYHLFRFKDVSSRPDGKEVEGSAEISLQGGLRLGIRKYLKGCLPNVQISGHQRGENLYIEYIEGGRKIECTPSTEGIWKLPTGMDVKKEFVIKLADRNLSYSYLKHELVPSSISDQELDIFRDKYGEIVEAGQEEHVSGNTVMGFKDALKLELYWHLFKPRTLELDVRITPIKGRVDYSHKAFDTDLFLYYLSSLGHCTRKVFNSAFETLYGRIVGNGGNGDVSKFKKYSLSELKLLGFIEHSYAQDRISVLPPSIVRMPANIVGRRALLIGARSENLVKRLISMSRELNVGLHLAEQRFRGGELLLPMRITFETYDQDGAYDWERNLTTLATELGIGCHIDKLAQLELFEYSASLAEYEEHLTTILPHDVDFPWCRKIFNVENLRFELNSSDEFEKEYTLTEYRITQYNYEYRLWKKGVGYDVDKQWGQYLVLKHMNKRIILYDSMNQRIAIPVNVSPPLLLFKALSLLGGSTHEITRVDLPGYGKTAAFIIEPVPSIIADNLFKKLGQVIIRTNI